MTIKGKRKLAGPTLKELQLIEAEPGMSAFDWQISAQCRGANPNLFYPMRGESTKPAKALCWGGTYLGIKYEECPVREECLNWAVTVPEERFGIWGGYSEKERRRIRVARKLAHSPPTGG